MTHIFISANNSTTTPLGANATFVGEADVLTSYVEIDINVGGAPAIAPATLYFEFSPDGTHWDISVPLSLDGPSCTPIILRTVLPFFRVRYVNGGTALTELRLNTVFHRSGSIRLSRFLSQDVSPTEPVELTRSVITGKRAADGSYRDVPLGTGDALKVEVTGVWPVVDQGNAGAHSQRWMVGLSDGAGFINPALQSQLPTSLTGSGNLKVALLESLPAGTAVIGHIIVDNFPSSFDISDRAARLVGHVTVDNMIPAVETGLAKDATLTTRLGVLGQALMANSTPVVIASDQSTLPVSFPSGVNATQGTPNTIANSWPVEVTDGTNVLGTAAHPLRIDPTGTTVQPVSFPAGVDVSDRAARLLGHVAVDNLNPVDQNYVKQRFDMSSPTVIYVGYAPLGTPEASSAWTIKRTSLDVSGNPTVTEWTSQGTATWDNRASETYN